MSSQQHDMVIGSGQTHNQLRADVNLALLAMTSMFFSDDGTAPNPSYPYQNWADAQAGLWKKRNGANSAWITIGTLDQAYLHANLSALAGLTLVADKLPYANGTGTLSLASFTAAARSLLDDATTDAMLQTLGLTYAARKLIATNIGGFGQCRLTYVDATHLKLIPFKGNLIPIKTISDWEIREIPSAGITYTISGLSASTVYYVYLYDSGGTLTLELSTTGHVTDGNTGVEVKSGDATRTIVGMVKADGSTEFSAWWTLSWFNRLPKSKLAPLSVTAGTTSDTMTSVSSELHLGFLTWGHVEIVAVGHWWRNGGGDTYGRTGLAIDSTSTLSSKSSMASCRWYAADYWMPFSARLADEIAEGYHYPALLGRGNNTSATIYWGGAGTQHDGQCSLSVKVEG